MGLIKLSGIISAKKTLLLSLSNGGQAASKDIDVPKGFFAEYAGESQKKRFVVPIYLLNEPSFQELLHEAEKEFGYEHPMGGITISCDEYFFSDLISHLIVRVLIEDEIYHKSTILIKLDWKLLRRRSFNNPKPHPEHSSVPLKCFASCADEKSLVT